MEEEDVDEGGSASTAVIFSPAFGVACHNLVAHVEEGEEALVVGGVGAVGIQHGVPLLHRVQVYDVNVHLLRNELRRRGCLVL